MLGLECDRAVLYFGRDFDQMMKGTREVVDANLHFHIEVLLLAHAPRVHFQFLLS